MASEDDAQAEKSELKEVDTKENEEIKVDKHETEKTDEDVMGVDTKVSNVGELESHDEPQEDSQVPDRVESRESAIAKHEKEPEREAEPEQPVSDTDNDLKMGSKMSMEMDTPKLMSAEHSAPQIPLVSETIKYEKSGDKFGGLTKSALGSIIDIRHLGESGQVCERKMVRYANSYKMEADNPFNPWQVDKILKKVIEETLENLTYDVDKCSKQAKWAATAIRSKVKKLNFDRYKIICLVTIGEKHSQDVLATCRFLWDAEKDGYAAVSLENTYVFGFAQCFGLYYE